MSLSLTVAPAVRFHLSLNVGNLGRALEFYRVLLGCEPAKRRPDYAKFELDDPPLVLYVRGNPEVLTQPGIAMVGTRHPTPYGSGMAERLACDLAAQGLVIISGMARGVDTADAGGAEISPTLESVGESYFPWLARHDPGMLPAARSLLLPEERSRAAQGAARLAEREHFSQKARQVLRQIAEALR